MSKNTEHLRLGKLAAGCCSTQIARLLGRRDNETRRQGRKIGTVWEGYSIEARVLVVRMVAGLYSLKEKWQRVDCIPAWRWRALGCDFAALSLPRRLWMERRGHTRDRSIEGRRPARDDEGV